MTCNFIDLRHTWHQKVYSFFAFVFLLNSQLTLKHSFLERKTFFYVSDQALISLALQAAHQTYVSVFSQPPGGLLLQTERANIVLLPTQSILTRSSRRRKSFATVWCEKWRGKPHREYRSRIDRYLLCGTAAFVDMPVVNMSSQIREEWFRLTALTEIWLSKLFHIFSIN